MTKFNFLRNSVAAEGAAKKLGFNPYGMTLKEFYIEAYKKHPMWALGDLAIVVGLGFLLSIVL